MFLWLGVKDPLPTGPPKISIYNNRDFHDKSRGLNLGVDIVYIRFPISDSMLMPTVYRASFSTGLPDVLDFAGHPGFTPLSPASRLSLSRDVSCPGFRALPV
jgi:hypothetical protein